MSGDSGISVYRKSVRPRGGCRYHPHAGSGSLPKIRCLRGKEPCRAAMSPPKAKAWFDVNVPSVEMRQQRQTRARGMRPYTAHEIAALWHILSRRHKVQGRELQH